MRSRPALQFAKLLLSISLFLKLFGCNISNVVQGHLGSDSNKISVSLDTGISTVNIAEGSSSNFILILSSSLATDTSLEWSLLDMNGSAATLEFPISSGTIVFPANQLASHFSIQGSNDNLQKGTRQYSLRFSNPSTSRLDIESSRILLSVIDDDIEFEMVPIGGDLIPQLTVPESQVPNFSHFEAKVVRVSDGVVVIPWAEFESGVAIEDLNTLDPTNAYYIVVRAVDQNGNTSEEVASPHFIAGSATCIGDKITNVPYAAGSGSAASPFLLCTAAQVAAIAGRPSDFTKTFKLQANVDFDGVTFDGIGSSVSPFKGVFDGGGYSIKNVAINRATGNNVGFFNATSRSIIRRFDLLDASYTVPSSSVIGGVVGDCSGTQLTDIRLTNISISGAGEAGGVIGVSYYCNLLGAELSGILSITDEVLGGIVGGTQKGKMFNVVSTLDLNAPLADGIGGIFGGDYWASTQFQSIQIDGDIIGKNYVGGFNGYNYDGAYIYRSSYKGTITGQEAVGGMSGVNWDSPYSVYSSYVDATINGNRSVGGFSGEHAYRTNYVDSYVNAVINGTGASQTEFGGFFGLASYYGDVIRSYANVTINTAANRVGGAVGFISTWHSSYDISNSFVVANIQASSASSDISLFLGQNIDPNPLTASNSSYWSGGTCSNLGGGGCNTSTGASVANVADFYSSSQSSLSNWNFTNVWVQNPSEFPTLNWNRYHTPSVSMACPSVAQVGQSFWCPFAITDADVNESQMIVFQEDHTCTWVYIVDGQLSGAPETTDVGTCKVSYAVTDGVNKSAVQSFDVTVHFGVAVVPAVSIDGYYSFGFHAVSAGAKSATFTFTNQENTTITGLSVLNLPATHFIFAGGGTFPGTTGTCGSSLAPGASCTVVISFDPSSTGTVFHFININYTNASGTVSIPYQLYGWGI